ncbi:MAG: VWA domain-containing protein [Candidatus Limnocylindrales bacterium]
MSFLWPAGLLSLLLIPLGLALYRGLERRRLRAAASSGFPIVTRPPTTRSGRIRRTLPAALSIVGLALMAIALARPQGTIDLPHEEGTVILAFDVSGSMAATDLQPTRMDAAKAAAKDFVERQPSSVVIGVVAFSDSGLSVQTPTNDQATVLAAIDRLTPQHGTSLGQGIQASLAAIAAEEAGTPANYYSNRSPAPTPSPTPVPAGYHAPAVIVLLSDGENNENPDPATAAKAAADQGVRIYTVGIGSPGGTTLDLNGFKVHTQLDAATLQQVSQVTDGTYYAADNTADLVSIYDNLDTKLIVKPEEIELTGLLAGASLVVLVAGGLTSLLWLGRLP